MQFGWIIGIGMALALGLSAVSIALTHRTLWKESPRDPLPLELAAEGLQAELDRLHSRYVDQLDALADEVGRSRGNTFGPSRTAARMVGVRTLTVLSLKEGGGDGPIHLEILERGKEESAFDQERFPPVAFQKNEKHPNARILDRDGFTRDSVVSGWVRESEDVFYFWKRMQAATVVLIGVDADSLRGAIGAWLTDRKELAIHHLQNGKGEFTRVSSPDGVSLVTSGVVPEEKRSPKIFPATIRFGTWQIQAWNAVEKTTAWNLPILVLGQVLSLILLIATILVATALRRATLLAERRVSFVNSASHELRSPITNMMLNVDLAGELMEENPAGANQRLDRVKEEAGRLSRLVDNLLTFSKSGKGGEKLRLEKVDPDAVLEETLEHFAALLGRRNIEVIRAQSEENFLMADPDALLRIYGNLLSNVEKYAAAGGELEIVTGRVDQVWRADFIDKGPGISREFSSRIFEPFKRASERVNEGVSGTGLGLTISRDLARRLGGDLVLVSTAVGATFRLTLPISNS